MRQNWIHQKRVRIVPLLVANLLHYSHGRGSSSEWVYLDKMDLWVSNLRAQQVQWAITTTTLYFFSFWFFFNENNKIKSQTR